MHNMLNSLNNSKTQSERSMLRERPLIHETSNGGWVSEWDVIVIPSLPFPSIRIRHLKTAKDEGDERPSGFSV